MKIVHTCSVSYLLFKASGSAKVAYELSNKLSENGHRVYLFVTDKHKSNGVKKTVKINDKFIIWHCNLLLKLLAYKYRFYIITHTDQKILSEAIRSADIVHIHEHSSLFSIYAMKYAQRYGVPYVLQAHGSLPRTYSWQKLKWLYDELFGYKLLRDASKVIALNQVEAEQYKHMGVPEKKIAIIPNGIDLSEYAELPPKGSFKKKFNIPEDRKIILYLGRIHKIKGIDVLVKAYAHLKNEMNVNDAVLVVAGPDDGFLNEVKSLTYNLGIADSVLFTGPLYGRDKLEAFVDSEVYVLPSRYETFPMTILEAYACGKPIVASRVGGLKDLVKNEETGLLFEPGNVEQLAKSIFNLLNDNGAAKEMGLKGKNYVRKNFTIEKVVKRLEKVYKEVIKS
jgi:glycosyltransferase involved in cell wall biosynthesis